MWRRRPHEARWAGGAGAPAGRRLHEQRMDVASAQPSRGLRRMRLRAAAGHRDLCILLHPPAESPSPTPPARTALRLDGLVEHELPRGLGARPSPRLKSECPGANLLGSTRAPPLPRWDLGQATEPRSHLLLRKLQAKTAPTLWGAEKSQRDSLRVLRTGPAQEGWGPFLVLPHLH